MSWIVVAALVSTVAIFVFFADGRVGSESSTNDGGAWLVNRSESVVGHVNRVVGEVASVAGPFDGAFEISQAPGVVVVTNPGDGTAVLIDTNLAAPGAPVGIPAGTEVFAAPDAVVAFHAETGRVWRLTRDEFGTYASIEDAPTIIDAGPAGVVAVSPTGIIVAADVAGNTLWRFEPGSDVTSTVLQEPTEADTDGVEVVDETDRVAAITLVGDIAVVLHESGALVVVGDGEPVRHRVASAVNLQQPGAEADNVVVVIDDGTMRTVNLETGEAFEVADALSDASIRPIVHRGCVWSISLDPTVFHYCGRSAELAGAGGDLRLTLVNGWVWINDVNLGGIWFVRDDDLEVTEISDWSAALLIDDETIVEEEDSGGEEETVTDSNADELETDLDNLDEDDINTPPDAVDDRDATRRGRPVEVNVLANDSDPDNDPLSVVELVDVDASGFTAQGARITISANGETVQVEPDVDFVGEVSFGYVVNDGRGGEDSARVVVEVTEADQATNRPPVAEVDNATVKAGESVAMNVLTNDSDPDGDVLVLVTADDLDGAVNFTPDGELHFTPDIASEEGTVEIEYIVEDDFGASATGIARIRVRPADSNQPPQARNDIGQTSVGHSVTLNVLANDVDPDGDPLVAQNLQTVDGSATTAKLSPDGTFIFRPEAAGTYRFTYGVSDGPSLDQAQVRISVEPEADNRPPVAVVDEVALAIGETRLVRVLDNDGDPDGDVVGLVDWVGVDGIDITEVPGIGFYVTATADAAARSQFRYWISDGIAEPVRGEVIVSALDRDAVDYPPVAVVDTIDARAGSTTTVYVLRNDYDPEGRPLDIVSPVQQPPEARVRVSPDNQTLLLTVNPDQEFGFRFSYDVEDPGGNRSSAIVQVRVVPPGQPNRAPIAAPDRVSTPHATPITIRALANDVDPDGDPIAIESIAEQPSNGTVTIGDDGNLVYVPREGFSGTDRFVYTLVDGYQPPLDANGEPTTDDGPARDLGEVLIGVMPPNSANRPPIAVDDLGFPPVALSTEAVSLDVLSNDSDPDDDRLTVTAVTPAPLGSVRVSERGNTVIYTPPDDDVEADVVSFAYTVSDGRGGTATAQVTLDLDPAPEPIAPVAVDDRIGPIAARSSVVIDPRTNDLDADGNPDELEVLVDHPAVTVRPNGQVEITAGTQAVEIPYTVRDEQGLESEAGYFIVIVAPNQAPVIEPIEVETEFETPIAINIHDSVDDVDQDPLVMTIGDKRVGGSTQVVDSGDSVLRVRFTPDEGFEGPASFDFVVDDKNGHTVSGTAVITVLPPENREPVANNSNVSAEAGIDEIVDLAALVDDPDGPDGYQFSVSGVSGPIDVSVGGNGRATVSSNVDQGGSSGSFTYTVVDGPYTVSATVNVELEPANFPAPTVQPDTARTLQGEATGPIAVLNNDVDNSPAGLAGDGLVITGVGVSDGGTATVSGRTITFTPNPDFFGAATFTYTVQDGRRNADGEASGVVTVNVVGRPAIPQAPRIESVGNRYVVVAWNPPAGQAARAPVTGYVLRYVADNGTNGEIRFDQPTTSYRWNGLSNAVEYCFAVAAVNEAGESEFSASGGTSCGTPDIRPESPPAPQVRFDDSRLHLTWGTPANAGSPIQNYRVRISGGRQEVSAELGVTNSYTWEGLENGTEYTFEVQAQNAAADNDGWSDWSPLSAPEHPLTVPDAPAQPQAERGDRQVIVRWQAPYDGGDRIQRYQVRSSLNSTWVDAPAQGANNSYVWENIPNGTDVNFQVRAVNRDPASTTPGNISPASNTVRTCAVPDAPAQPSAVRGDTEATITWARPNQQGCAISEFRIQAEGYGTQTAGANATSYTFTGLTNGQPVRFRVTAVNEVVTVDGSTPNASPWSNSVTPAGPPRPTNVSSATNTAPRTVRVRWTAPDDNGSPITGYQVSVNGGSWQAAGNGTEWTHSAGNDGTSYSYRVRAINDAGTGASGNQVSATTWDVPNAPGVSASRDGDRRIQASWNTPSTNGTGITGQQLARVTGSCPGSASSYSGTSYSAGGLSYDTTYRVCVRYRNDVGWGNWGSDTVTTNSPPQPSVSIWWGPSATGQPGCATASCRYVRGSGSNFASNTTLTAACQSDRTGSWETFSSATVVTDSNGSFDYPRSGWTGCYFGYQGERVRLVVGGVASSPITN